MRKSGPGKGYRFGDILRCMIPTREDALALFKKYNENESLYRHALSVEAVMRRFAAEYGEDEDKWGIIGLVHDLDWDKWPREHCSKTREILEDKEWPETWIRAVLSHAWGFVTDIKPEHVMEKVLYAIDELCGLVTATALMRPSRSLMDLNASSVKKKWKDKSFAAGVNREVIDRGAMMLGIERSELIEKTIEGMRVVAPELGLE